MTIRYTDLLGGKYASIISKNSKLHGFRDPQNDSHFQSIRRGESFAGIS